MNKLDILPEEISPETLAALDVLGKINRPVPFKSKYKNMIDVLLKAFQYKNAKVQMEINEEYKILSMIYHPCIISPIDNPNLPWSQRVRLGLQTATTLHDLMTAKCGTSVPIIHRDIKGENILIDDSITAKVIDFGVSRMSARNTVTDMPGTPLFKAPELINRSDELSINELFSSELYSLSLVFYTLATSKVAFEEEFDEFDSTEKDFLDLIRKGKRPDLKYLHPSCHKEFQQLIVDCWSQNPSHRPQWNDVIIKLNELLSILEKQDNLNVSQSSLSNNDIKQSFEQMEVDMRVKIEKEMRAKIENEIRVKLYEEMEEDYHEMRQRDKVKMISKKQNKEIPSKTTQNKLEQEKLNFEDGYYIGKILNGKSNGYGITYYNDGNRYEGEHKNNMKHGKGTFYNSNGDRYEGEFKNNNTHGKGIEYFTDGSRFDGIFVNGSREGFGIIYYSNGDRCEGQWENNQLNGKCTFYNSNGDRYEGHCKDGVPDGEGIEYYTNGDRFEGLFRNGDRYRGTFYFIDGYTEKIDNS